MALIGRPTSASPAAVPPSSIPAEHTRSAVAVGSLLVDLDLEPVDGMLLVGQVFEVRLIARTDSPGDQTISSIGAALLWDATHVEFIGNTNDGPYGWLLSQFPDDSGLDDLNSSFLDGDAFYQALSNPLNPAIATPEGLHVTTLLFEAKQETAAAAVMIVPILGSFTISQVAGADFVGQDVTGQLGMVDLHVCTGEPGDTDDDGVTDCLDLCPDTLPGELTDSDGCSCSQLTCDDGLFCTGVETCDVQLGCQSDGNPCTAAFSECDEDSAMCLATEGAPNIFLTTDKSVINPSSSVTIDVFIEDVTELRLYEVVLKVSGGLVGSMDLADLIIEDGREDFVFAGISPLLCIPDPGNLRITCTPLSGGCIGETPGPSYLGAYTFNASADALGVFKFQIVAEPTTFLRDCAAGPISFTSANVAVRVGCETDVDCDDGLFCTGEEICDAFNVCQPGDSPCTDPALPVCNEDSDACVECLQIGDVDGDGDTDLDDFADFKACETGPVGPSDPPAYPNPATCRCLDSDDDGDIDLSDFAEFQRRF